MDYQQLANGALLDTRPADEKAKDFLTGELYGAPADLVWLDYEQWKLQPENIKMLEVLEVQNQANSYSCMANAGSLAEAIDNWSEEKIYKRMSARSIYPFRRNNPALGMWSDDLGNIICNRGVVFEALLPSEGKDEAGMNDLKDFLPSYEVLAKIYKAKNYLWIDRNVDAVASILAKNKAAIITVLFGNGEWAQQVPVVNDGIPTPYGHGICALPNAFFMYKGKKAIMIQDSWGVDTGLRGRRIITEDWFIKNRVTSSIWFENLSNIAVLNETLQKPKYVFKRWLSLGMIGNDVAQLQRCLGYLKDAQGFLFPLAQEPTGYYGGITRNAVKRYQTMKALPVTGNVDQQTIVALNSDFV